MADENLADKIEDWTAVGQQLFIGARDAYLGSKVSNAAIDVVASTIGKILGAAYIILAPIGIGFAEAMSNAEDEIAPAFSRFAASGINDIFGTNISAAEFARSGGGDRRLASGDQVGRALLSFLRGSPGEIQPGDGAAIKYVNAMAGSAIEDWFKGWFFEILSSLIPQLDVGKIEAYGGLGDKVANVLGLGGISRRVLRPLVDTTITTPLEWKTNQAYRPRLLTAGEVARQVARGRWTREQGIEELSRQGYADRRIEALFNASRKFASPGDVRTFLYFGYWTNEQATQHLRDAGYDEQAALDALRLEGLRRNAAFEDQAASIIIGAYASRDIDQGEFRSLIGAAITNQSERTFAIEIGELRRLVNRRGLSIAEVRGAVRAGVLSVIDYRRALERAGYGWDDVLTLELVLRAEMDAAADREEQRRLAIEEREREELERQARAAARAAELEQERAERARGPVGALEQAAIRGLIPIERVSEVYAADYDPDAVAILESLLTDKRTAYVAAEERRQAAEQRAARRGLSIGQYRAAVFAGTLTIEEYAAAIEHLGIAGADLAILVATTRAQWEARNAAIAARREAQARAQRRRIDLGRYERLVRQGARSVAEYESLLRELGFDDGSIAGMRELLELQIADDTAARQAREQAERDRADRGPTPTQYLRGVVLGAKTIAEYESFLIAEGFNADALIVLLAEARAAVADAEAARARRAADTGERGDSPLPLATVRRAARVGVIAPDVYFDRARAAGYSDDDIAIDSELLFAEIADVQAKRAAREAREIAADSRGVALGTLARAVRVGTATIDQYRTAVAAAGYAPDAAGELIELLEYEIATLADARARREAIAAELAVRELNLAQLEELARKELITLDEFSNRIGAMGYGAADTELLIAMLIADLEGAGAGSP